MNQAIHFKTSLFDISVEKENPINPIYGLSLLEWLRNELSNELTITEPEPEDWGWYSEIDFEGISYLIGSCALLEDGELPNEDIQWVFQIDRYRSFKEKLLGRNKMDETDPCLRYFINLFKSRPEFKEVQLGQTTNKAQLQVVPPKTATRRAKGLAPSSLAPMLNVIASSRKVKRY